MILFFYNLALLAALVAGAPWWLWKMATTHKYREGLIERLGWVRLGCIRFGRIGNFNSQPPNGFVAARPLIWVHAVSVGEVLAVSRLVNALDAALPGYLIAVSTTTRTGQALARERFGANRVFYCPLDLPWAVRAYARISDRSWPRYRRLRWLWKPFLSPLGRILAQSETDAARLKAIGCQPERLSVAGNLKFDVRAAEEADATRQLKALAPNLRLIVAGSTLEGEESALLEAWPQLLAADPQLALVLAPRHPERFGAVAALLASSGVSWVKRSDWRSQPAGTLRPLNPGQIVLLDTIGELASIYSLAAIAFVGGSLIPAGGHNPLEPAQFGVPIVMGPHYANFRAIASDLLAHRALRIANKENLAATLIELLQNSASAQAMGERAKQVFDQQAGATVRCVEALRKLLPDATPGERPS